MTTKRLLCLVSDRRRLAAVVGRSERESPALLLDQIRGAAAAGIDLVQIREPDLDAATLVRLVRESVAICAGSAARVVVNDRVDVARAAGAHGVHLREDSFAAARVRELMPGAVVGRSIHTEEGAAGAGRLDYLVAGTVFPTASKPGETRVVGLPGLARIVRAAHGVPVLAIGGVTAEHARELLAAGAAGLAAIGAFLPDRGEVNIAQAVQKIVRNCRFAFDSASTVP